MKMLTIGMALTSLLLVGCSNNTSKKEKVKEVKIEKNIEKNVVEEKNTEKSVVKEKNSESDKLRKKLQRDYIKNIKILEILEEKEIKKNIFDLSVEDLYAEIQNTNTKIIKVLYEKGITTPRNMIIADYKEGIKVLRALGEKIEEKDLSTSTPEEAYVELQSIISKLMKMMLAEINNTSGK